MSSQKLLTGAVIAAASLTLSCSSIFNNIPGFGLLGVRGPDLGDLASTFMEAENRCGELGKEAVAYPEEADLGGAVALNWASRGGGLFLDDVGTPATSADLSKPKNAVNVYVATVGKNLALQSTRPSLDWAFGVLESTAFNAYSAPGGYVMVTRGLLQKVQNEAQLAGVLAHEVAHITQKHALTSYQKVRGDKCRASVYADRAGSALSPLTQGFQQVASAGGLKLASNLEILTAVTDGLVEHLLNNGLDEGQEFEADRIAVELVARAGYNPYEYVAFLEQIPEGPNHFGKHPGKKTRQERLRTYLKELEEKDPLLAANGKKLSEYEKVPLKDQLVAVR